MNTHTHSKQNSDEENVWMQFESTHQWLNSNSTNKFIGAPCYFCFWFNSIVSIVFLSLLIVRALFICTQRMKSKKKRTTTTITADVRDVYGHTRDSLSNQSISVVSVRMWTHHIRWNCCFFLSKLWMLFCSPFSRCVSKEGKKSRCAKFYSLSFIFFVALKK